MPDANRRLTLALGAALLLAAAAPAAAQKRPKRALSESDARRAVASAPGLALKTGDVRVKEISAAGVLPVTVVADVKTAIRFSEAEGEAADGAAAGGAAGAGGAEKRWRASEFRTGDRSWEELDRLAPSVGAGNLEGARLLLAELAREFEARRREGGEAVRGPVRMKEFSALLGSAVGEVTVEATFRLERGANRRWRVAEVTVGGVPSGGLDALLASFNLQKAERARADLRAVSAALEEFRRERGFYVVADTEAALVDHLSPRYLPRVIRLDPWLRPYRYAGTRDTYRLSSDGPDGLPDTPDDLTVGSRQ